MTGSAREVEATVPQVTEGAGCGRVVLGAKRALLRAFNVAAVAAAISGAAYGLVTVAESLDALSNDSTAFILLGAFLLVILPLPLAYLAIRRWAWVAPERLAAKLGTGLAAVCAVGGTWAFVAAGLQALSGYSWPARLAAGLGCWLLFWSSLCRGACRGGSSDPVVDLTGVLIALSAGFAAWCVVGLVVDAVTGEELLDSGQTEVLMAIAWFCIPVVALTGLSLRRGGCLAAWMQDRPRFFAVLRAGVLSAVAIFLAFTLAGAQASAQLRLAGPELVAFAVWAACLVTPLVWLASFARSTGRTAWRWAGCLVLVVIASTWVLVEVTHGPSGPPEIQPPQPPPTPLARTYST